MRTRMALGRLVVLVGIAASAGCAALLGFEDTRAGDVSTEGGADGGFDTRDGGSGSASLSVTPTALVVRRGGALLVQVKIIRGVDLSGPVTALLAELPPNVSAAPVTIEEGQSTGTITLAASQSSSLGATTVHLRTDAASLPSIDLMLLVADPAGALDSTFDTDGVVIESAKGPDSFFYAVAAQPDGKIIAAGSNGPGGGWLLRRYFENGSLDTAFNAYTTALPTDGDIRAIAIGPAGAIVLAGSSSQALQPTQMTVVRLLSTGALDTSFSGNGVYRLPAADGVAGSVANAVGLQPNGAVVVAGSRKETAGDETALLFRVKSDGTRDTGFAGGAVAVKKNRFVGVSVDATGIVVAGTDGTSGSTSYTLARYSVADGTLDPTFGTNGTSTFAIGFRANGFARLPGGSYALVGESTNVADPKYTAGLATPEGSQVWTRNTGPGAGAAFRGAAAQADGKLVATGFTPPPFSEARIDRILADGGPDNSFGDAGTSLIERKGSRVFEVALWSAAVANDGRILASGNRADAGAAVYRVWP